MRAQLNQGVIKEYSFTTIIAIGECAGFATFEIECEIPENFENEFWEYEAVIKEEVIIQLNKK